jgi:hypothetical protein
MVYHVWLDAGCGPWGPQQMQEARLVYIILADWICQSGLESFHQGASKPLRDVVFGYIKRALIEQKVWIREGDPTIYFGNWG